MGGAIASRKASSLAETILAMFLLVAAALSITILFHQGLRNTGRARATASAVRLAENKLAEMRDWAADPGNFRSGWGPYNSQTFTDPNFPGYSVFTEVGSSETIFTPCTTLGTLDDKRMTSSVIPVRVTVSWDATDPGKRFELNSHIGAPPTTPAANISITTIAGSAPVPNPGNIQLEARLQDSGGTLIPDMMYRWYFSNGSAEGSMTVGGGGDNDRATVFNSGWTPDDPNAPPAPGNVKVRVRCRYHGKEIWGRMTIDFTP